MGNDSAKIQSTIQDFDKDIGNIEQQIIDICYHMKGGISWESGWMLSHSERERIISSINAKLKAMSGDTKQML